MTAGAGRIATAEVMDGVPAVHAVTTELWRRWLADNCASGAPVWLIVYRKKSGRPSVRFHDAIEHALCFGWVDSKALARDRDSCYLRFSPRNPKSTWGRINRERAERMIERGLMTEDGQALIDLARRSGTWDAYPEAHHGVLPSDLRGLLDRNNAAAAHFDAFPPSSKRVILEWIARAKRPETRRRRVLRTVELAADNLRSNHPHRGPSCPAV